MPDFLYKIGNCSAMLLFLAENLLIVASVVFIGLLIRKKNTAPLHFALGREKTLIVFTSIIINSIITFSGFLLWKQKSILFTTGLTVWTFIDFFILLLTMDLAMYILHLAIHKLRFIYKPVHSFHHRFENPDPIDLFVLSPFEAFAFGVLWLILIYLYSCNIYAVVLYLITNVLFGMIGHLSIEPFPANWIKIPVLNYICTSTFHHQHHLNGNFNFGFYTIIWDELGKTLAPDYKEQFLKNKSHNE